MESTASYRQATGQNLYGVVRLSASPAATFSFRSDVQEWPGRNHERAVREGILDALAGQTGAFVLLGVCGPPSQAHRDAFYEAAKLATAMILQEISSAPPPDA